MNQHTVSLKIDADGKVAIATLREVADETKKTAGATRDASGRFVAGAKSADQFAAGMKRTNTAANDLTFSLANVRKSALQMLGGLGVTVSAAAFAGALLGSATAAIEFRRAMDEVSTLLDDTSAMDEHASALRELGVAYGTGATAQAKAYYQAISAGAQAGAQALGVLDAANKLAIGGVTDITTATDGLTNVLNAYGNKVQGAADVSDILFTAMKAGKTTIGELSANIGTVAPIASGLGVEFHELSAAIAAITTAGVKTSVAVTNVRQALVGVAKPAKEAQDLAASLGLEFNLAAIKAKGFSGFLEDVRDKTGGSQEMITKLFGSVEAFSAVMALTGPQAEKFNDILGSMETRAGQTAIAFQKMNDGPAQVFARLTATLQDRMISLGEAMLTLLVPAAQALTNNIDTIGKTLSTSAKVAAAYLIIFKLVPAVYLAAEVAGWRLIAMMQAKNLTMAQSMTQAVSMKQAFGLLAAAFVGWEIGTWARENFLEVRLAGLALVEGLLTGAVKLQAGWEAVWALMQFAATASINAVRESLAGLLTAYLDIQDKFAIFDFQKDLISSGRELADSLGNTTDASAELTTELERIARESKAADAAIRENIGGLVDWEIQAEMTKTTGAETAAVLTGVAEETVAAGVAVGGMSEAMQSLSDSLASQILQLQEQKIGMEQGAEAALLFNAMNALGVTSVAKLDAGIRKQITTLVGLRKEMDAVTRAQKAQIATNNARAQFLEQTEALAAQLNGPLAEANLEYAKTIEDINNAFFEGVISATQAADAMDLHGEALDRDIKKIKATTSEAQNLESILSRFDDIGFKGLVRDINLVKEALEKASKQEIMDPAEIERLRNAVGGLRHEMVVGMVGAAQQVLGAMQTMAKEGSTAYKAMEVAQHALNVVMAISAILNQGKGDPYTAFARMAAMAVAVIGLVGSIGANFGGSNGFTDTAAERQESQGTGTVLGDTEAKSESILNAIEITADATSQLVGINRGMLRALVNLNNAIGNATGLLARDSGQTDFGALPRLNTPSAIGPDPLNLLGGTRRVTDEGILIMGNLINGIAVEAYQEIQSRSWRFGSRRTRERTQDAPDDVVTQFQLIIDSMVDAVRQAALALGVLPDEIEAALASFAVEEIRISLMDLSAEEQQAELQAVFSSIFDGLAGHVVPFIEQFQRVGEGLGETLVRVATGVQITREAIDRLGFSMGRMSENMDPERFAQISEALVNAVGGIEEFINGMNTFIDAFASEEHQFEILQRDLTRAFEQVGLAVPATRDGMWELMQSLDATTEAGQEQIATLLRLAGVASAYYDALEDREESGGDDPVRRELRRLMNIQDALQSLGEQLGVLPVSARTAAERQLNEVFDEHIAQLVELNAGELALTEAHEMRAEALLRLIEVEQQAADNYASFIDGFRDDSLLISMRDIERQQRSAVTQANILARAAGMQGAAEEDLAVIHTWAASQIAKAIAAVRAQAQSIVDELQAMDGSSLDDQIAYWEALQLEIQRSYEQQMQAEKDLYDLRVSLQQSLTDWLNAQLLDPSTTSLTVREQYEEAQAQFAALSAAAMAGDTDAMAALPQMADLLLGLGQSMFASGEEYTALEQMVRDMIEAVAGVAYNDPGEVGPDTYTVTISAELAELYAQRELQLAEAEAAHRMELANVLAGLIGELSAATGVSLSAIAEQLGYSLEELMGALGISLDEVTAETVLALNAVAGTMGVNFQDLVNELGLSMDNLTGETVAAMGLIAMQQGIDLQELADAVGAELGTLAERQSLLNQALDLTLLDVPPRIADGLAGPLEALRNATTEADQTAAMEALLALSEEWPDEVRDLLAPYFDFIDPTAIITELDVLHEMRDIDADMFTEMEAQTDFMETQVAILEAMRDMIAEQNMASELPSYAVGTAYVPRTGPALLHEGEAVMPANVAGWLRSNGMLGSNAGSDETAMALLAEIRALREQQEQQHIEVARLMERLEAAERQGSSEVVDGLRGVADVAALAAR